MSFRVIACVLLLAAPASAQLYEKKTAIAESAPLPKPAEVRSLIATPQRITLTGGDATQQLIITATLPNDRLQDLTGDVQYSVADSKIAQVSKSARVVPLASGTTEIAVRYGGRQIKVPVE